MRRELLDRLEHEAQIGMAVAAPHRRADREEHEIGLRRPSLARSVENLIRPMPQIALEQLVEARLVNRHAALVELLDLGRVLVDAGHVPAELGKAGGRDQADITSPNHANVHETKPLD